MKNKKGFTLIELLAVIIILGILMIIAIPSVTKYISDSRKNTYVDTAKELISGARNMVNNGKLGMYDTNSTYYIPSSCIKVENGNEADSPYGKFTKAYIGVIYDGKGYRYYWTSVDETGQGVNKIIPLDKLDAEDIESDLKDSDIEEMVKKTGIGDRSEIKILNCNTNSWDGQYHLDDISNNVSEENGGGTNGNGSGTPTRPVCVKAINLHKVECKATYTGCYNAGFRGSNKIITYGTIVNGDPKAGDAYDCDVNNDGTYDEQTERFYYVGSEGSNSILIYYTNINNQTTYSYDSSDENWHGPRTGYQYLPSTTTWSNPGIIAPGTRQIVDKDGNTSTAGGTIEEFTYTNKAARLLTAQELVNACPSISAVGNVAEGELDGCNWFMENVGRYENYADANAGAYGYWLETPRSDVSHSIYDIWGNKRRVYDNSSTDPNLGIRPVITVKTSNLG